MRLFEPPGQSHSGERLPSACFLGHRRWFRRRNHRQSRALGLHGASNVRGVDAYESPFAQLPIERTNSLGRWMNLLGERCG